MIRRHPVLLLGLVGLAAGLVLHALGRSGAADAALVVGPVAVLGPLLVQTARAAAARRPDVDLIALLAIAGALATRELLAAAIVAVMLAGGQALEEAAGRRAERALESLLREAPRTARLVRGSGLVLVDVAVVAVGDEVLVAPGEVVPVDGVLLGGGVFDEATLTGESVPVRRHRGDPVASGVTSVGGDVRLRASATAADSTYAGIIRLVQQARHARSPGMRLADRWAGWFVPITLTLALAAWDVSGDPVRGLAVLVVATPCPLLLAVPIAMVSGISRAARHGVIVKHGGALEGLAAVRTICLDKTGTVTTGRPQVSGIIAVDGTDAAPALRLAAALEQVSAHPFAAAVVASAGDDALPVPASVLEEPGEGVMGRVDGHDVVVGGRAFVAGVLGSPPPAATVAGGGARGATTTTTSGSTAWVGVDGRWAAQILLADPLREDAAEVVAELRRRGVEELVMLTGDDPAVADRAAAGVGITQVRASLSPAQKVAAIREIGAGRAIAMVGDGVNDAPALAAAQVGVAMGARGATASSETADMVITADRLTGLLAAHAVAVDTVRIARQSALLGMGLSLVAMGVAAAGHLSPASGALLQEGIDLAAILNALRALRR